MLHLVRQGSDDHSASLRVDEFDTATEQVALVDELASDTLGRTDQVETCSIALEQLEESLMLRGGHWELGGSVGVVAWSAVSCPSDVVGDTLDVVDLELVVEIPQLEELLVGGERILESDTGGRVVQCGLVCEAEFSDEQSVPFDAMLIGPVDDPVGSKHAIIHSDVQLRAAALHTKSTLDHRRRSLRPCGSASHER